MRQIIHLGTPSEGGNQQSFRESFTWEAPDRELMRREYQERLATHGRELWSDLHTSVTIETLAAWEEKIPNYSCKCKAFYTAWKIDHPPRQNDFFAWTVELHNAVNTKLSKPTLTLDEARQLWMV